MAPRSPTPAPTPTLAALQSELSHLHVERLAVGKLLDGIPGREHELLERNAPDHEFAKVDLDRRRGHHRLQKLNERHVELDDAILAAEAVEKTERWNGYVDQYEDIARRMVEAANALTAEHGRLFALCNESQRAGFTMYGPNPVALPYPVPIHVHAATHGVLGTVPSLRLHRFGGRSERLYVVRFRDWTEYGPRETRTAYMTGQEAGFSAEDAWALVLAQRADFADATNIPPRPPTPQRRPRQRGVKNTVGQGQ